jgi:phosphotransferase system IIB component
VAPPLAVTSATVEASTIDHAIRALGGRANIGELRGNSTRVFLTVRDPALVDENALLAIIRAVARPAADSVHLVVGPQAGAWLAGLRAIP